MYSRASSLLRKLLYLAPLNPCDGSGRRRRQRRHGQRALLTFAARGVKGRTCAIWRGESHSGVRRMIRCFALSFSPKGAGAPPKARPSLGLRSPAKSKRRQPASHGQQRSTSSLMMMMMSFSCTWASGCCEGGRLMFRRSGYFALGDDSVC